MGFCASVGRATCIVMPRSTLGRGRGKQTFLFQSVSETLNHCESPIVSHHLICFIFEVWGAFAFITCW